jgi:hypothetical protein
MRPGMKRLFLIGPAAIVGIVLFFTVGVELVLHLWNWLLPPIFGWRQISFWQAFGLLALCRILFGGFGVHGAGRTNFRRRMADRMADRMSDRMGERMAARWDRMTPDERERFLKLPWASLWQEMRGRCGFGPATGASQEPEGTGQ